ncbi:MAG: hypothetical protein GON13_03765 [Nanoarchaeota archaeon]|nr:hypothetical protein [Nanoarchaeota archaeon]
MAKINNQEVLQKLIDELKLYPATDAIPTELAEKILPVFQINSQDVNVSILNNPVMYRDSTLNDQTKSFFVPSGKTWVVLNAVVKYVSAAGVANRYLTFVIKDDTGEQIYMINRDTAMTASTTAYTFFVPGRGGSDSIEADTGNGSICGRNKILQIPKGLILLEGWEIEISYQADRDAADDMFVTLQVDEQDN